MVAFVGGSGLGQDHDDQPALAPLRRHRGRITIDGHDVREINLLSLRQQIGVGLQESVLFHATIRENLRYGRLDATDEEIEEAARAANIHHVIEALPRATRPRSARRASSSRSARSSAGDRPRPAADPRILVWTRRPARSTRRPRR
jgi:ABC-type multidrug transport system fused ATPase/permease subunit